MIRIENLYTTGIELVTGYIFESAINFRTTDIRRDLSVRTLALFFFVIARAFDASFNFDRLDTDSGVSNIIFPNRSRRDEFVAAIGFDLRRSVRKLLAFRR